MPPDDDPASAAYKQQVAGIDAAQAHSSSYVPPEPVELFIRWAMDRARGRNDHGFGQPMQFDWWDDGKWAAIAGRPRGTVGSEAYVRDWLANA